MTRVLKIGHRGAAGYEPENTLRSFQKATELGADMIELDVQKCQSGELVVVHDFWLNRTTNGHGLVAHKTLKQLKLLDAGRGEKIPTLPEVVAGFVHKVSLNIELKGKHTAAPVAEIVRDWAREKTGAEDQFLLSSMKRSELETARQLLPHVRLGIITGRFWPLGLLKFAQKIRAYSIHLSFSTVTKALVTKMA